MKNTLFILFSGFILLIANTGFSQQSDDVLDKGFNKLYIDAKMNDVKAYLTAAAPGDLKHENAQDLGDAGYFSSGWLFNLTKAGITTYHGLTITRIEVYFNPTDDYKYEGGSDQPGQDIFSFAIYIEKPADNKSDDFVQSHFDTYGGASYMPHPETEEIVGFTWFTSVTMLDLRLGYDFETDTNFDYYLADWRQAYGG